MKDSQSKRMRLQGLSFKEELLGQVIDFQNKFIYLSLVPWEICNWSCSYCHQGEGHKDSTELSLSEMKGFIREAAKLGFKAILLLGGEVLLKNRWAITQAIVQTAFDENLITLIYTNGSQISEEMIEYLAQHNVSMAFKVDSLNEERYDLLTGRPGSFESTMNAISMAKGTSLSEIVMENDRERLVRLLFTTVGCKLNYDEYISLARFATNNGARWMMESLNYRGNALQNQSLALSPEQHADAMKTAMLLNSEQRHEFQTPCRLLSCITIRKGGEIGICPQDYHFSGNIHQLGSLSATIDYIRNQTDRDLFFREWNGRCPIKKNSFTSTNL